MTDPVIITLLTASIAVGGVNTLCSIIPQVAVWNVRFWKWFYSFKFGSIEISSNSSPRFFYAITELINATLISEQYRNYNHTHPIELINPITGQSNHMITVKEHIYIKLKHISEAGIESIAYIYTDVMGMGSMNKYILFFDKTNHDWKINWMVLLSNTTLNPCYSFNCFRIYAPASLQQLYDRLFAIQNNIMKSLIESKVNDLNEFMEEHTIENITEATIYDIYQNKTIQTRPNIMSAIICLHFQKFMKVFVPPLPNLTIIDPEHLTYSDYVAIKLYLEKVIKITGKDPANQEASIIHSIILNIIDANYISYYIKSALIGLGDGVGEFNFTNNVNGSITQLQVLIDNTKSEYIRYTLNHVFLKLIDFSSRIRLTDTYTYKNMIKDVTERSEHALTAHFETQHQLILNPPGGGNAAGGNAAVGGEVVVV